MLPRGAEEPDQQVALYRRRVRWSEVAAAPVEWSEAWTGNCGATLLSNDARGHRQRRDSCNGLRRTVVLAGGAERLAVRRRRRRKLYVIQAHSRPEGWLRLAAAG